MALALQSDGWLIRNAITWHKPNAIPDPARDRLSNRHEILFLLTTQPDYHLTADALRTPVNTERPNHRRHHAGGRKPHTVLTPWNPEQATARNLGDVWSLPTRPTRNEHSAAFPIDLPKRCIAAGCPENGTVLDPFSESGTTGLAAQALHRTYRGIDLRTDYHNLFLSRRTENTTATNHT